MTPKHLTVMSGVEILSPDGLGHVGTRCRWHDHVATWPSERAAWTAATSRQDWCDACRDETRQAWRGTALLALTIPYAGAVAAVASDPADLGLELVLVLLVNVLVGFVVGWRAYLTLGGLVPPWHRLGWWARLGLALLLLCGVVVPPLVFWRDLRATRAVRRQGAAARRRRAAA